MPGRVTEAGPGPERLADQFIGSYLATKTRPAVDRFLVALGSLAGRGRPE